MGTGESGTFVISWAQTCVDGQPGIAVDDLQPGMSWSWSGRATRIDGPDGIARLGASTEAQELHRRAAVRAQKINGKGPMPWAHASVEIDGDQLLDRCFVLTDGCSAFAASCVETGARMGGEPLVLFLGDLPPPDVDLWIARITSSPRAEARARQPAPRATVGVCADTLVATSNGQHRAEDVRPGDLVETLDNGMQTVLWTGTRRVSGVRLHLEPYLRPIRIAAGAFGQRQPSRDLWVSRDHRLLVSGQKAGALFSEPEVLVRANDLVGLPGIVVDLDCTSVVYVHLMFEIHHILSAEDMPCESFHPDEADLVAMGGTDRWKMDCYHPGLLRQPEEFGPPARRRLDQGEAAIFCSALA